MVQPLGTLVFSQREVPLNFTINKMGARNVTAPKALTIDSIVSPTTNYTDLTPTEELFAPGQFTALKEDEKLSKPSFEKMKSGVRIGDTGVSVFPKAFIKAKNLEYEIGYVRPEFARPRKRDVHVMLPQIFGLLRREAAPARSMMSWQSGLGKTSSPKKQEVRSTGFVIGNTADMKLFTSGNPTGFVTTSRFEADQITARLLKEKPALAGTIQVMADFEMTT
jgi:hypothetical protein